MTSPSHPAEACRNTILCAVYVIEAVLLVLVMLAGSYSVFPEFGLDDMDPRSAARASVQIAERFALEVRTRQLAKLSSTRARGWRVANSDF